MVLHFVSIEFHSVLRRVHILYFNPQKKKHRINHETDIEKSITMVWTKIYSGTFRLETYNAGTE
jgi:hypothetical protein